MIAAAFKHAQGVLDTATPQQVMVAHTDTKSVDAAAQVAKNATLKMQELEGARGALAANDPTIGRADMGPAANDPIVNPPSWGSAFKGFTLGVLLPFDLQSMQFAMSLMGAGSEVTHNQPTQYLTEPSAKSSFGQVATPETPAANDPSMDAAYTMPSFAAALDGGPSAGDIRAVADEAAGAMRRAEAEWKGAMSVLATDEDALAAYDSFAGGLSGFEKYIPPEEFARHPVNDPDYNIPAMRPAAFTLG